MSPTRRTGAGRGQRGCRSPSAATQWRALLRDQAARVRRRRPVRDGRAEEHEAALDEIITTWTTAHDRGRPRDSSKAGVAAFPSMSNRDLVQDGRLNAATSSWADHPWWGAGSTPAFVDDVRHTCGCGPRHHAAPTRRRARHHPRAVGTEIGACERRDRQIAGTAALSLGGSREGAGWRAVRFFAGVAYCGEHLRHNDIVWWIAEHAVAVGKTRRYQHNPAVARQIARHGT
jgi:hypothetical protein